MSSRALFLCPSPFEIGTYHRALAFARHLVRHQDYEVDLLCTGKQDSNALIQGVRVIQTSTAGPNLLPMRGWNPGEVFKRLQFVRKQRVPYSLVYSFEYQPNVWPIARYVARRDGARQFNDWCDWYAGRHHKMKGIGLLQKLDARMEEYPRTRVDCVTTICSSIYERALACGVPREKLLMVREGAELSEPLVPRAEARSKLGVSDKDFIIFGMADSDHTVARDGIHELVKTRPEARLVITGNVKDIGEDARVRLPGRVSDAELHLWLCAADCAWLPLEDLPVNHGRLPHKIGHFRVYGLPLITTGTSDAPRLGDPGITIVDYSAEAFAAATARLAPLTDAARAESQKSGLKVFAWENILAEWEKRVRP